MLLFVDESGTDHKEAPYEILAGIAIRERVLWPLIQAVRSREQDYFGITLGEAMIELKGKKLLKSKVFRFADQADAIPTPKRTELAHSFLEKGLRGQPPQREEFTAYGQAVLAYVQEVFGLCAQFGARVFASIVNPHSPQPSSDFLRKDYVYLFERFFYYLEDVSAEEMGVVVFDELEKARCQRLLKQMEAYFLKTHNGRMRSSRIIPEPFFVHSDLTLAVQLADIIAYSLNWGWRLPRMDRPTRPEMENYGQLAFNLRYVGQRFDDAMQLRPAYGITYIEDLRPREARIAP